MKKILWITNVPSRYRVDFFNELGKLSDGLMVIFEKRTNSNRETIIDEKEFRYFDYDFLTGVPVSNNMALAPGVIKYVKRFRGECIVVHNPVSPTGMLAIEYMKSINQPYYIESDGGMAKDGKGIRERVKKFCYSGAVGYLTTSHLGIGHLEAYGANRDKICIYPFTSLSESDILEKPIPLVQKGEIKKELNIPYKRVIITVGQFIHRKGIDILLKALPKVDTQVGLVVIGGQETDEYKEIIRTNELRNVMFIDFQGKQKLWSYYQAADLFVFPSRYDIWGLVVNEALANGLPVISTRSCVAATELVIEGRNGYLYDAEDVEELGLLINKTVLDQHFLDFASAESLKIIGDYTLKNMAKRHMEILGDM